MEFCDTKRYLTVGMINKQFNSIHRKEDRVTSAMGFLESGTPLVDRNGEYVFPEKDVMYTLIRSKNLHKLIPHAIDRGLEWDHFCVEEEATRGNREFFAWLSNSDLFWIPENAYASAAEAGDIELMDFFITLGLGYPDSRCKMIAERSKNKQLMDWIERMEETDGYALSEAVKRGDVYMVEKMFNKITCYSWIVQDAVRSGSSEVLYFLLESEFPPMIRDLNTAREMHRDEIILMLEEEDLY